MTNRQKLFLIICAAIGLMLGPFIVRAQQQYSGGQAVTVSSGTITATQATGSNLHVAVDSAPSTAVTGTFWQSTQPVSGTFWQSTQPVSLASLPALAAGTAKVGMTYPYTGCGTTQVESGSPAGLAALPTSTTVLFSSTSCAITIEIANTSSSTAYTYTITDNASTPIPFVNAASIQPLERDEYTFPNGMKFNAGIKWSASNAAVTGYVLGVQ